MVLLINAVSAHAAVWTDGVKSLRQSITVLRVVIVEEHLWFTKYSFTYLVGVLTEWA